MSLISIDDGTTSGQMNQVVTALTPGASVAIDASTGGVFTLTPGEDETITVNRIVNGAELVLVVVTSGVTSRTLTFSTGFKTTGTLATGTTTAKTFVMRFVAVNGVYTETSRTAAM